MNKKLKLSLCLQVNEIDGLLDFSVDPPVTAIATGNLHTYEFEIDGKSRQQIRINLRDKQGEKSHIIVKEIRVNNRPIDQMDLCTRYVVKQSQSIENTYGYLDRPGTFFVNIHQNSLVHNYLAYFRDRCKKSKGQHE
jgi:hypothetical protein